MLILKNASRRQEEKKRRKAGGNGYNVKKKLGETMEAVVTMEKNSKMWSLELPRPMADI